jgi:hypothetical protein
MAKVFGPLGSFEASGRIGQHSVHFNWKGINVVRKWTKPTNPRTNEQGEVRTFIGGLGRATKPVVLGSQYQRRVLASTPTGITWVSYIIKLITQLFGVNYAIFENEYLTTQLETREEFTTQASNLGLTDFRAPAGTNIFSKEVMLYALYRAGRQLYLTGVPDWNMAPYNKAPHELEATDVQDLVNDIST